MKKFACIAVLGFLALASVAQAHPALGLGGLGRLGFGFGVGAGYGGVGIPTVGVGNVGVGYGAGLPVGTCGVPGVGVGFNQVQMSYGVQQQFMAQPAYAAQAFAAPACGVGATLPAYGTAGLTGYTGFGGFRVGAGIGYPGFGVGINPLIGPRFGFGVGPRFLGARTRIRLRR